jgi:hypothetical protein
MSRLDLPFVVVDKTEGILKSHWCVPHDSSGAWADGVSDGCSFFAAVAKLAERDEGEAAIAMCEAVNAHGWKSGGWGAEYGFSRSMVEAAIVGLRAIRSGLVEGFSYNEMILGPDSNAQPVECTNEGVTA